MFYQIIWKSQVFIYLLQCETFFIEDVGKAKESLIYDYRIIKGLHKFSESQ